MSNKKVSIATIFNLISIIGLIVTVILSIYGYMTGIITSFDRLHIFIDQSGIWGPLLFTLIQIIQVVIPILPGGISCAYGVLLFGPGYGFIYNYVGIVIGSVLAFLIARQLGKPFLRKITPNKLYQKYITWLDKGSWFDKLFALGIFLPGALFIYSLGLSAAVSWFV